MLWVLHIRSQIQAVSILHWSRRNAGYNQEFVLNFKNFKISIIVLLPVVPGEMKLKVEGQGVLADMYRSIVSNMDPREGQQMTLDTTPCLPRGSPPDYYTYRVIG